MHAYEKATAMPKALFTHLLHALCTLLTRQPLRTKESLFMFSNFMHSYDKHTDWLFFFFFFFTLFEHCHGLHLKLTCDSNRPNSNLTFRSSYVRRTWGRRSDLRPIILNVAYGSRDDDLKQRYPSLILLVIVWKRSERNKRWVYFANPSFGNPSHTGIICSWVEISGLQNSRQCLRTSGAAQLPSTALLYLALNKGVRQILSNIKGGWLSKCLNYKYGSSNSTM